MEIALGGGAGLLYSPSVFATTGGMGKEAMVFL